MTDSPISQAGTLDRRRFLKVTGGFLLAFTLEAGTHRALADTSPAASVTVFL